MLVESLVGSSRDSTRILSLVTAIVPKVEFVVDPLVGSSWDFAMLSSKLMKISQQILNQSAPNFQNRADFSELVKMCPKSAMLQSKMNKT